MSRLKRAREKFTAIFCAVFRHSNIVSTFFGYVYCGRCKDQIGDCLGSVYRNRLVVSVDCDCVECRANLKKATWVDLFMCERPKWLAYPVPGSYNAESKRKADEAMQSMQAEIKKRRAEEARQSSQAEPTGALDC